MFEQVAFISHVVYHIHRSREYLARLLVCTVKFRFRSGSDFLISNISLGVLITDDITVPAHVGTHVRPD